jgi:Peptidase family M1 domain
MPAGPRFVLGAVGLAAAAVVAGCTSVSGHGTAAASAGSTRPFACPTTYAAPDPQRPRVALAFDVRPGLTSVDGTEHITFTPDRPITELVFRLTANTASTVAEGNGIVVHSARADHGGGRYTFTSAAAASSTQGGLLHIPFASTIAAGTTVTADITFTVTLGPQSFDRFGRTGGFAWFGSAEPLLAWQRGFGWHAEDMIQFPAESATSEAMDTELTVTAPAADTVIMSGDPTTPRVTGTGTRTWQAHLSAARDVSVAVGPFAVSDTVVGGVHLRVGAYSDAVRDQLVPEFQRAITQLSARLGPYPFPSLSVARLPASGGGIEYPSSILMLDGSRVVAVHETAHQWFYAMVGDSQALHPWLDEAFAQYSEQLVNGDLEPPGAVDQPGTVDRSTESYGADENDYYRVTYAKGSAALEAARRAAGAGNWDRALRCYVAANAWRITDPADLARAIAGLPAAVTVLKRAGALP